MLNSKPCADCGRILLRRSFPSIRSKVHFCNVTCKGNWQRRSKPVTREWLYEQYVTFGKGCPEIGKIVNRDPKVVWSWLRGFNITTRHRGSDINQQFKKGCPGTMLGKRHSISARGKIRAASIKDGRVPYLKNGVHHLKGKRGFQTPNWKGGTTPDRQTFYASAEWKAAVKIVWGRTGGTCERCGIKQTKEKRGTYHIHHIVSFMVRHLRASEENLALLCKACHLFIHSRENTNKELIREASLCSI